MYLDPLENYLRPGYPKENLTEGSYRNSMEYVGERSVLAGQVSSIGQKWGTYPGFISPADFEDIEGTNPVFSILRVIVETKQGSADYPSSPTGDVDEVNDEVDWASIQRSMYEHPAFRIDGGGIYQLTSEDVEAIKSWERNPDMIYKQIYVYKENGDYTIPMSSLDPQLSLNAQMFAKGIQQGIEYYNDFAPVVRRQSTFVGGPPPQGNAGQKEDPPAGLGPPDYEWIKNADRALKSGGQTRWRRDEEWLGAKKVLVDRDEIFWTAPT